MPISAGEHGFIVNGLSEDCRCDGRGSLDLRHLSIRTGSIPFCNGSCAVRRVNTSDFVLAGVKLEVITVDSPAFNVSVECFDRRNCRDLVEQVEQQLKSMVNSPGVVDDKYVWGISVDIIVMGSDGNLSDLISLAVYSALQDTKVPNTQMIETEEGMDFELTHGETCLTSLESIPIRITLYSIQGSIAADVDEQEEQCADASLSVLVNRQGSLCRTDIHGGLMPLSTLAHNLASCTQIALELFKLIDKELLF